MGTGHTTTKLYNINIGQGYNNYYRHEVSFVRFFIVSYIIVVAFYRVLGSHSAAVENMMAMAN